MHLWTSDLLYANDAFDFILALRHALSREMDRLGELGMYRVATTLSWGPQRDYALLVSDRFRISDVLRICYF